MKKWHFNLRTKMMIYFFVCVVIPIIGFGILLLALQQRNTEQFMVRTQETSVLQLSDRISQEFRSIQSISNLYYLDSNLIESLSQEAAGNEVDLLNQLDRMAYIYSSGVGNMNTDIAIFDATNVKRII